MSFSIQTDHPEWTERAGKYLQGLHVRMQVQTLKGL